MLVVRVEVDDVDVPTMPLRCTCCFVLPLDDVEHARVVSRDVAMSLGADGVVVDEVRQAVSIANHWPID